MPSARPTPPRSPESVIGALVVAVALVARAAVGEEPRAGAASPAEIAAWIDQLGSAQYARREAAARSLVEAGRPALDPLREAVEHADLEVASRGVEIMREWLSADDAELVVEAETSLERLATGERDSVSRLAEATLDFHQVGMAEAARKALESVGAVFREQPFDGGSGGGWEVEFNAGWQGGSEEWRQLARLRGVTGVSVHGVRLDGEAVALLGHLRGVRRIDLFGTQAPEAAVAALAARLPDALIDVRKGGKLGVRSRFPEAGVCAISGVQPGSAAEKAGLRDGDVIVMADGGAVDSFDDLTARVARHDAGESMHLEVVRDVPDADPEHLELTVRLDAW